MDLSKRIKEFGVSNENPRTDFCTERFVGRGSHASASVYDGVCSIVDEVIHKVLLTAESPQDVADAVLNFKAVVRSRGSKTHTRV